MKKKKNGKDVALLFVEILLLAFGPALFAGGLFPILFSSLDAIYFRTAVVAAVSGFLSIGAGASIAAFRYAIYN